MKNKVLIAAPLAGIWILLYFTINKLVHSYTYFDYKTPFDSFFPFLPIFTIIYILTYFFIFIPLFKTDNFKEFVYGFLSVLVFTLPFFIFFPGTIQRPELIVTGVSTWLLSIVYTFDYPHNLFPSLHVSMMMFAALVYNKKWFYGALFLVALSTLFVKQHYFVDVIGGLIIGTFGYLVYKKLLSNQKNNSNN